jgi:23S rRNA pseudouridine955/2504/2580 synthase
MKELLIEKKDAGQRLDKYLRKYLKNAPSSFLYRMLRKKNIILNDSRVEGKELLSEGDTVKIYFSEETLAHFCGAEEAGTKRQFPPIEVIYEDADILIADKPSGLLSQGDKSGETSLNDWLREYCRRKGNTTETFRPTVCNRLDRNTSGLVLCAKTYAGSRFLSEQIGGHELGKYYRALVEGELRGEGTLRGIWYKDEAANRVRIEKIPDEDHGKAENGGRYVETRYRVIRSGTRYSLVELRLMTGRSHQIRAHMASIGHPLAGDLKYGGHPCGKEKSQFLQAFRIVFPKITGDFAHLSEKCFETAMLPEFDI